jgi:putative ABC transport system permease protein
MSEIRRWFHLRDVVRDVDDEMRFYFEETARELEAQGMTRAQAREEAQRRFGDERHYRRELLSIDRATVARERWSARVDAARMIARHAVRNSARSPGLAAGIVLAFALGIGANATMYATVERLLLRPPPHIEAPDNVKRLLVHRETGLGTRMHVASLTYPDYEDFKRGRLFSDVAAQATRELTIGAGTDAEQVRAVLATPNYWSMLGVRPARGRFFTAAEDGISHPVVISWNYWQRRWGGGADALGATIDFGQGPYTIVGVAPQGFTGVDLHNVELFLPFHSAAVHLQGPDEWRTSRNWYWLRAIARVAPGATVQQAEAEATALHRAARAQAAESPDYDARAAIVAAPLLAAQGPNAPSEVAVTQWLLGVALIVLVIACLNVANLLLARAIRQRRELSIRLAIGITRRRLIAQVMAEGVVLALLGGAVAVLLATWGGTYVQRTLLPDVEWPGTPSRGVILAVALLSLAAGIFAALLPALQASRRDVNEGLRTTSGGITRSSSRIRATMTIVQAALSVVLLIGAGLFVRSLDRVRHGDFGLDPWQVANVEPAFFSGALPLEERLAFYDDAAARLSRIPGIAAVTTVNGIPFWSMYAYALRVPGLDSIPMTSSGGPYAVSVGRDYFRTLGIALRHGRLFNETDFSAAAARTVVVSESMARAFWPDQDALGKCMQVGEEDPPCSTVVGVVEDARHGRLVEDVTYQYYIPLHQRQVARVPEALLVRVSGRMEPALAAVRAELVTMDPRIRFVRTMPLEEMLGPELRQWRLGAVLFSLFGLLALIVSAIGLYSLLAFDVAQRVREIGLRTALGANTRLIVGLVVTRAVRLTALGVAAGGIAALIFAPRLKELLYEVRPRDPLVFGIVIATLGAVALVAAGLPALRAARVDAMVALRAD